MTRRIALIIALLVAPWAQAETDSFSQCLVALQDKARTRNLPAWIVDQVIPGLALQPRVIELDRAQPEFTQTFGKYYSRLITDQRVAQGRQLRDEYRLFLTEISARYGVPAQYLIAFWGLETRFGANLGAMPTLDSLATLACDDRRSDFFTGELMNALQLLDRETLQPGDMQGSWAGAVGHTQFMPSAYLKYAVDGDWDGHINLWKSPRDALASGANFLMNLGWQRNERWGREVLLPENFPYEQTGLANRHPLRYWSQLGVTLPDKSPLPVADLDAAILLPSGHTGPAFLVYRNFDVIMGWNRSEFYALAVGVLADRIAGGGILVRPPDADEQGLSRDTITRLQQKLNQLGYDAGRADGILGTATRSALRAFQEAKGGIADGYPDASTLRSLALDTEPAS